MISHWQKKKLHEICILKNGNGFTPREWDTHGLPIIRIQNLNGSKVFNYYSKTPDANWIIIPGDILFAWAGTKGVSFGPCIWNGTKGVLNQHIYKVIPSKNVDKNWLYRILILATENIEKRAHGLKKRSCMSKKRHR